MDNFDTSTGRPYFNNGDKSLKQLVKSVSLPTHNIVVSMSGGDWGHVLLIDEIWQGKDGKIYLKYSDNTPKISKVNGSNPPKTKTLEEFYDGWHKSGLKIKGAVAIGKR